MNLANAFTQRNRLKSYISGLTSLVSANEKSYKHIKPDEDFWKDGNPWTEFNGVSYTDMITRILTAKEKLGELNTVIDAANVAARPYLNKIESLKSQAATLERICSLLQNTPSFELYKIGGPYSDDPAEKVAVILDVVPAQFYSKLQKIKSEIMDTEDQLSEVNGRTNVEVPESLMEYLSSYNR